jgi:hypothetical protein
LIDDNLHESRPSNPSLLKNRICGPVVLNNTMFQVALRRPSTIRKLHGEILQVQRRPTLSVNSRLLSSHQLSPWNEPRQQQINLWDSRWRIAPNYSCVNLASTNKYRIQDGVIRLAPSGVTSLQSQRRWFSDKKQPKTDEKQEPGRLGRIVPALRQRVTHFNTGDLMSVYVIFVFILVIIFSPFIAK